MNPNRLIANLKCAIQEARNIEACRNNIALEHHRFLFNALIDNSIEELKGLNLSGEINKEELIKCIKEQI